MDVSVGLAAVADVGAIAELLAESERYYGMETSEPVEARAARIAPLLFADQPAARVLLAWIGDTVAGMAAYTFLWPAAGGTRSLYLKELYVREAARGSGAGRALMARLAEIAIQAGCSRMEWTADDGNEPAERFYRSLGVPVHPSKRFYRVHDLATAQKSWTSSASS